MKYDSPLPYLCMRIGFGGLLLTYFLRLGFPPGVMGILTGIALIAFVIGAHRYWALALGACLIAVYHMNLMPALGLRFYGLALAISALAFTPIDESHSLRAIIHRHYGTSMLTVDPAEAFRMVRLVFFLFAFSSFVLKSNLWFLNGNTVAPVMAPLLNRVGPIWFHALCVLVSCLMWSCTLVMSVLAWIPRLYRELVLMAAGYQAFVIVLFPAFTRSSLVVLLLLLPFVFWAETAPETLPEATRRASPLVSKLLTNP